MKLTKYVPAILAISATITLIAVAVITLHFIHAYDRANVSHDLLTRLQATNGQVDLWQRNYLAGVRALADDPGLVQLVDDVINHKIDKIQAGDTMNEWLRPIYLGRGYEGHSIIDPDYNILLSSSPNYTGRPVTSPTAHEVVGKAIREGSAIGRPIIASYPITTLDKVAPAGTPFQLGCASITRNGKVLAVLCLRQSPYQNFFAMLSTGFSGTSGETYAVDRQGNIISPTRFGQAFIQNKPETLAAQSPIFVNGLQARAPIKTKTGELITTKASPLTKSVAIAMKKGESGLIEHYHDYRGVNVVGVVRWLPTMDIGIVVEQDVKEVYAPYNFFRNAILAFTLLAISLINILLTVMAHGRKRLAEREQCMSAFLNHLPGYTHMRAPDGKFLIVNRNLEQQFGLINKMIGADANILPVSDTYIQEIDREHEEIMDTGRVIEKTLYLKDYYPGNGLDWVKLLRFPIFDPETSKINAVGTIMLDISEQMRNAQKLEAISQNLEHIVTQRTAQLEAAKQEAEQAVRVKSDFLANMSHEIRTPMNAIIGLSHLATLVSDDPKLRSYLERIHQSSTHLLSIINDILDFSKIEAGMMTIEQAEFSLEEMLDNVLGLLWDKADAKDIELLVDIDPTLPDRLKGDALRIGQILINFTSNAVKFTETGNVLVKVYKTGESSRTVRVRFDVEDSGIGIADESFTELFTPFHQLDTSSTRRFEGTGLGLTISKNLTELMGGALDIRSEIGRGSTFSVELELTKSIQQEPHVTNLAVTGKRVLVVDDNAQAREILDGILKQMKLEVICVDSGAAAIEQVKSQPSPVFDLIFIDWKMPGMSGSETAEQLSLLSATAQTKLILLCPHSKHDLGLSTENLFAATVCKPVIASAVKDSITKLFKHKHLRVNQNTSADLSEYRCLAGSKVLLVDDNDINQDVVKELLNLVQADITTAANGREAIELLEHTHFDVVLMDVQMPIMDGIEATRRLRVQERFDQLPIIAMTAGALAGDRERCLSVGMNDYISKPIYPDILYRILLRWYRPKFQTNKAPEVESEPAQFAQTNPGIERLYQIPGLEVDEALERLLHNETLYLTLISRFLKERATVADELENALANNKTSEASNLAHSFKSLAGSIGAVELQELALKIEIDLNLEKDVQPLLQNFRLALNDLRSKLSEALNVTETLNMTGTLKET
jgi:two-component system, sensor histidine kinase and response regulator